MSYLDYFKVPKYQIPFGPLPLIQDNTRVSVVEPIREVPMEEIDKGYAVAKKYNPNLSYEDYQQRQAGIAKNQTYLSQNNDQRTKEYRDQVYQEGVRREESKKHEAERQANKALTNKVMGSTLAMVGLAVLPEILGVSPAIASMIWTGLGASATVKEASDTIQGIKQNGWDDLYKDNKAFKTLVSAGLTVLPAAQLVKEMKSYGAMSDAIAKEIAETNAAKTAAGHTRTKVGDVEIDNPQLGYRVGTKDIVSDFNKTNTVRTNGSYFENPMFSQGKLWSRPFKITKEGVTRTSNGSNKTGLLVTHGDNLTFADAEGRVFPQALEDEIRRVPIKQLSKQNTSAYIYDPNYGYRLVRNEPKMSLELLQRPSSISLAEIAGVPKQERNLKLFRGKTLDQLYHEKLDFDAWEVPLELQKEYETIINNAKKNGTFLKNADGSYWYWDPRAWVQTQHPNFTNNWELVFRGKTGMSKDKIYNFLNDDGEVWMSNIPKVYKHFSAELEGYPKYLKGLSVPVAVPKGTKIKTITWDNPHSYAVIPESTMETGPISISELIPNLEETGYNALSIGPVLEGDESKIAGTDFIIFRNTPRKAVEGNNGLFDINQGSPFKKSGGRLNYLDFFLIKVKQKRKELARSSM